MSENSAIIISHHGGSGFDEPVVYLDIALAFMDRCSQSRDGETNARKISEDDCCTVLYKDLIEQSSTKVRSIR